jgi:sarcosine oxidase delta subunit
MELTEDFKKFIKYKYFHYRTAIKNPSAFTSIWFHRGGKGRFYVVRSKIIDEIKRITQNK